MSLFDLDGKVAIVTGSSKGIGLAAAQQLAAQGARVVISSRKADACDAAAAGINAKHGAGRAIAIPANISSKEALEKLVAGTRAQLGPIDILVCNAASNPHYGPMATIDDAAFRKVLDNNIISNHWLIQMVSPEMKARGNGAIVIVSSIGGLHGTGVIGAYNISKAADFQLARNLAIEFGASGVRINCVAPGVIRTDFARVLWEDPAHEKMVNRATPIGRVGEPADIAGAIVFLSSPASAFMTGQSIVVDGGLTIAGPQWT